MPIPDTTAFSRAIYVLLGHMTDRQIAEATHELRTLAGSDADRDFYHGLATAWENYATQRDVERAEAE
jgi:hypothetical protein